MARSGEAAKARLRIYALLVGIETHGRKECAEHSLCLFVVIHTHAGLCVQMRETVASQTSKPRWCIETILSVKTRDMDMMELAAQFGLALLNKAVGFLMCHKGRHPVMARKTEKPRLT